MDDKPDPALDAAARFEAARQALNYVMERKAGPHFVTKAARDYYEKGKAFEAAVPTSDAGRLSKLKDAESTLAHSLGAVGKPMPAVMEGADSALGHVRAVITSLEAPEAAHDDRAATAPPRPSADVVKLRPSDT